MKPQSSAADQTPNDRVFSPDISGLSNTLPRRSQDFFAAGRWSRGLSERHGNVRAIFDRDYAHTPRRVGPRRRLGGNRILVYSRSPQPVPIRHQRVRGGGASECRRHGGTLLPVASWSFDETNSPWNDSVGTNSSPPLAQHGRLDGEDQRVRYQQRFGHGLPPGGGFVGVELLRTFYGWVDGLHGLQVLGR